MVGGGGGGEEPANIKVRKSPFILNAIPIEIFFIVRDNITFSFTVNHLVLCGFNVIGASDI